MNVMVWPWLATEPFGLVPMCWATGPSNSPGLTSRSRATVIKMAQPHMPARPRRCSVRRPALSTKSTCRERQGLAGGSSRHRKREGLGGGTKNRTSRTPRDVKPVVQAITQGGSYRDQGEDSVDHTSSYGGIGWLAHPCRLEDAG
jgi:hypothetical protein